MANWGPVEWAAFLIAVGTFLNTALNALTAFLANLARIRSEANGKKIDDNTDITVAGTQAAATHAKTAAGAAAASKSAAEALAHQLNGSLDGRIVAIVKDHTDPILKVFAEHNEQDERNMLEIRKALVDLKGAR